MIMKMTRIGFTAHLGGWDSAISIAVMPNAQMSTYASQSHLISHTTLRVVVSTRIFPTPKARLPPAAHIHCAQ